MTNQDTTSPGRAVSPAQRWLWRVTKWMLCALVLVFVVRRALALTEGQNLAALRPDPLWSLAAALAYAAGWLPAVWFWRRMIRRCGSEVGAVPAARAYFCGHLGKYVPGKATVLVIRSALLKPCGCPLSVSALTATFETLITMGVGAALAIALAPQLLPESMREGLPEWVRWTVAQPLVPPLLVLMAVAALLPVLSQLLTLLSVRMTPSGMLGGERAVRMDNRFLAVSLAVLAGGWMLHGLSLGCTLRAVGGPFDLAAWPAWVGSVAASTVTGFLALFAPGGIGVREGILLEVLRVQPGVTETQAVATPLLLRGIWFLTEVALAGLLYISYIWRSRPANAITDSGGWPDQTEGMAQRSPTPDAPSATQTDSFAVGSGVENALASDPTAELSVWGKSGPGVRERRAIRCATDPATQ